ncbi:MAG: iron-containing alcohol dehydrogenase [Alicyclobacillus sp.]|nr:iron-containing alcohol dehydrogenase [Alicyclobacillus sp.]
MTAMGEFRVPPVIYSGRGSLQALATVAPTLGTKALVVTDQVMSNLGYPARVCEMLHHAGVAHAVYAGVNTEPTDVHVDEGLQLFRDAHCDFIVAIGGGSCIDAGKAVAVMAVHDGYIGDYMAERKWFDNQPAPLVAIPTTAGTGSEVTSVTVITNTRDDVKMMIRQPALIPSVAIVDAELTLSSPPKVTAATGIDALCHAVEAYLSRRRQPLTDALALSAIDKIMRSIERAYADGQDLEAREQMSMAAMQAGMAFTNASVCLVHGMSRPIGALFHVPHGISNAMLLPTVLRYSAPDCEDRLADIGRTLNPDLRSVSDEAAAADVLRRVDQLCANLAIPNMQQWGIHPVAFEDALDKMATDAIASGSPANNPKVPSHGEIVELYRAAYSAQFAAVRP